MITLPAIFAMIAWIFAQITLPAAAPAAAPAHEMSAGYRAGMLRRNAEKLGHELSEVTSILQLVRDQIVDSSYNGSIPALN